VQTIAASAAIGIAIRIINSTLVRRKQGQPAHFSRKLNYICR
jgi:hypothetical protein